MALLLLRVDSRQIESAKLRTGIATKLPQALHRQIAAGLWRAVFFARKGGAMSGVAGTMMPEIAEAPLRTHVAALNGEGEGMTTTPLLAGQHAFLSGNVISRNDETVHLDYSGALYVIDFAYDDTEQHKTFIVKISDNVLKFTLMNCFVTNGIFYNFSAGMAAGKPLELRLFIHTIGDREKGINRSISYTLAYASEGK